MHLEGLVKMGVHRTRHRVPVQQESFPTESAYKFL